MNHEVVATPELPDLSNLKDKIRECAREVDARYANGNAAAHRLGLYLFDVWVAYAKQDQTCPEHVLFDRVEQFVNELNLDPDDHIVPHREQLRAIITRRRR
jgi:hypothetical protein